MRLILFTFFLVLVSVLLFADGVPPIGSGTETNPYQISSLDNLLWLNTNPEICNTNAFFIQTADINALDTQSWNEGAGWIPLPLIFNGEYNGQGYHIDGLFLNSELSDETGFFGCVYESRISNLDLLNVNISGNARTGGLAGIAHKSEITHCSVSGTVTGTYNVGGLVGCNAASTLDYCNASGSISGISNVGGISGSNSSIIIIPIEGIVFYSQIPQYNRYETFSPYIVNCYTSADICGTGSNLGGISGSSNSCISNSYYNFETVLINGEHILTQGALYNEQFETWLSNNLSIEIDNYFEQENGYYQISTPEDLKNMLPFLGNSENRFRLVNSIDLSNDENFFLPSFSGTFEGSNYAISNLSVNLDVNSSIGLFGIVNQATIKNLIISDAEINGHSSLGILAARCDSTYVFNCSVSGNITGSSVGGLIGTASNTLIENCLFSGNLTGTEQTGGLVGWVGFSEIRESCSFGSVDGLLSIGGLTGVLISSTLSDCFSFCSVTGNEKVGGIAHYVNGSIIDNCYFSGDIICDNAVGGLFAEEGDSLSIITNSFWNIESSGQAYSAGGTGKTTAEMQNVATYTDLTSTGLDSPWDFIDNPFDDNETEDIWGIDPNINDGYPYLVNLQIVETEDNEQNNPISQHIAITNYPNPFSPTSATRNSGTTISFTLAENSMADVKIYNLKGQLVNNFGSGFYDKGTHTFSWNGRDDSNQILASGVYFVRITAGELSQTKKIMIVK
ncbi:MAG: T9SS type A sorting domain-containing protein [Candidatus Cloacimonetes bacterium]|nr:T9SS type A sorting domain-containing protein [Candidatus Cloacimonadota bacterium]